MSDWTAQRYREKYQSIFICLTTSLLKHFRNCLQLPWNTNFSLVGTWIIRSLIENFIPAICSAIQHVCLKLIRAQKAVYINQPGDGNMIAAVLVYNTTFYMVQSLSLIVYSSNEKPCLCLALWLLISSEPLKAAKKFQQDFFPDV